MTHIRLRKDVHHTSFEDGTGVLLDGRSGTYWQLNATANRVLAERTSGKSTEQVAHEIAGPDNSELTSIVRDDIRSLVGQLVSAELVEGCA